MGEKSGAGQNEAMQTADRIQVALLCVQIGVGIVQAITTFFFIKSVGITKQQEKDAKDQILLAQKQMDLMTSQYRESLRPLIAVTYKREGGNAYELEFRNEGLGPALSITCDPDVDIQGIVIGSKSAVAGFVSKMRLPNNQLYTMEYKSLDGGLYSTSFYQDRSDFYVVDYRYLDSNEAIEQAKSYREGFVAATRTS
jgi:hypothetical protein